MLVQLGDFTVAQAGPDEEHPYLPEQAIALMAEFQRAPQLTALAVAAADATNASLTELPASYKPPPRPPRRAGSGSRTGWRRWLRGRMAWAGWASVGAALVVVGVILGAALSSSSAPSPLPARVRPRPPGHYAVHGDTGGAAAGRLTGQLWVHHRSSWRERQAGSSSLLRSAEVMMPCSIRIRTATSSESRTSAAASPRSAILRRSTLMCSATRADSRSWYSWSASNRSSSW